MERFREFSVRAKNGRGSAALYCVLAGLIVAVLPVRRANAQTASPPEATAPLIRQAQTLHIPIHVFSLSDASPIADLLASELHLNVDDKPVDFHLSRPWDQAKSTSSEAPVNLLIVIPLASPLDRTDVINEAILALKREPPTGWNISILDDSGNQTPYTRRMPIALAALEKTRTADSGAVNLADWRSAASLAIGTMRDLPGRRVVLTLGDIFHIVVIQDGDLVYDAFDTHNVAEAARNSGAILYAAESSQDISRLRKMSPQYTLVGNGPWMLIGEEHRLVGWISGSVSETLQKIRHDRDAAYDLDFHLDRKQMDGMLHRVSVTSPRQAMLLSAPAYYVAPSLAQLEALSLGSTALLKTLETVPSAANRPLQLATQMEYFPHPDGKTGTQIISTGLFWTKASPPPSSLQMALRLRQTSIGFAAGTFVGPIVWSSSRPIQNVQMDVMPGAYQLRVAVSNATGKITAGTETSFTVAPADPDEKVRISSLVLGRACIFSPESLEASMQPETQPSASPQAKDYLRAGNCTLQLNPGNAYSPQDIVWTLVRVTPIGELAKRPSNDWKGSFQLVDANGSRLAQASIRWLSAEDGSLVGTAAFPLGNPKLKLSDGDYDVVFKLKGPGIERDYAEDAPFLLYGAEEKK